MRYLVRVHTGPCAVQDADIVMIRRGEKTGPEYLGSKPGERRWKVEYIGEIDRGNAIWLKMTELVVIREGKDVQVRPDDMSIGEIGLGTFRGSHLIDRYIMVERTA